ncbi:MAG: hypothetical protein BGO49_18145 [Planctomycetales bacterium 71-10]|nr:MAG: hypothetical protein BGO49_18145 [Planctomycetales bacterium 71-10]
MGIASMTKQETDQEPGPSAAPAQTPARAGVDKGRGRFVFVDALRGVAAMGVVVFHVFEGKHLEHLAAVLPAWLRQVIEAGHLGVPVFFVLSGFVIAHSVRRYTVDLPFIGRFALRRSIRLDPPYWVAMLVTIGLGIVSKLVMPSKPYAPPTGGQILAHILYLPAILDIPWLDTVYWTLAYEVQFYLVFCLLMGLAHATRRDPDDRRSLFLVFTPALLIAAAWPLGLIRDNIWPGLFPPLWHGFLLGMLACWAMNRTVAAGWFYAYAALLLAGAAWRQDSFTAACAATAILLYASARLGALRTWLGWRWLQFLGAISYSIYLLHNPISGAAFNVGYRITGRSAATEAFWLVVVLGLVIAAASAAWWLVERPSLALAHRIRLEPGPAVVAPAPSSPAPESSPA